jgi:hypothetical protein
LPGPRLAIAEELGDTTDLWAVSAADPAKRVRIASVQHRDGWAIRAAVAPNGTTVAYAVLPRNAVDPDTQSELWALPLDNRSPRRLASGVDLRGDLVWSTDSQWVSYQRVADPSIDVRRVNTSGAGDQLLVHGDVASRWYLMGYSRDGGSALFADVSASGTVVGTAAPGQPPRLGKPAGTSASRDFTVSPDGRPAMLVLMQEGGRSVYRAVAAGPDGTFARLTAGGTEDTGIAWNPRTGVASVGVVAGPNAPARAADERTQLDLAGAGFDVPVAWSLDGRYLALRHFSGDSTDAPGSETVVLQGPDGRRMVAFKGAISVTGWISVESRHG